MRISVLVACYNAERYIADALRSVIEQVAAPGEVIVVDDGSTDKSASIIAGFGSRIILIRQANRGVAAALNAAAARATGDAMAFIDADDVWAPGKLALQTAALEQNEAIDGVFGHMRSFVSEDLAPAESARFAANSRPEPGLVKGTLLLRRAAFDRYGGFDEDRDAADFIAWYARAVQLGFRWAMLPEVLCFRRIHDANMGRLVPERQREQYLLVMKAFLDRRRAARTASGEA